ncbi:MAG: hypothetical protein ACHQ49_16915, partial [Elusimicrobiota bacterium]
MTPNPLRRLLLLAVLSAVVPAHAFADPASDAAAHKAQLTRQHSLLTSRLKDLGTAVDEFRQGRASEKRVESLSGALSSLPGEVDLYVSLQAELSRPVDDPARIVEFKSQTNLAKDMLKTLAAQGSLTESPLPDQAAKVKDELAALLAGADGRFPGLSRAASAVPPRAERRTAAPSSLGAGSGVIRCSAGFDGGACAGGGVGATSAPGAASGRSTAGSRAVRADGAGTAAGGTGAASNGAGVAASARAGIGGAAVSAKAQAVSRDVLSGGVRPQLDRTVVPTAAAAGSAGAAKAPHAAAPPPAPAAEAAGAAACRSALADHSTIASLCAQHPTMAPLLAGLWESVTSQFGTATGILMNVFFMLFGLVTSVLTGPVGLIFKFLGLLGMGWALWSIIKQIYAAVSAYRASAEGSIERFNALKLFGLVAGGALIMVLMVLVGYGSGKTKLGKQAAEAMESGMRGALGKAGILDAAAGLNKKIPAPVVALLEKLMGPAPKEKPPAAAEPSAKGAPNETAKAAAADAKAKAAAEAEVRRLSSTPARKGRVLIDAVTFEAVEKGRPNVEYHALTTLRHPTEIAEFVRYDLSSYPEVAAKNIRYLAEAHVADGTQRVWLEALKDAEAAAKAEPAPVRASAASARAELDVKPVSKLQRIEDVRAESVRAHAHVGSMGTEDWTTYKGVMNGKGVLVTVPSSASDASFLAQAARRVEFEKDFGARSASKGPADFSINHAVSIGEGRLSEVFGKEVPRGVDPKSPIVITEQVDGGVPLRSARETGRPADPKQLSSLLGTLKKMGYAVPEDKVWDYVYQKSDGSLVLTSAGKLLKAGEAGFTEAAAENGKTVERLAQFSTRGAELAASADRLGQWSRIFAALEKRAVPESAADRAEFARLAKEYVKSDQPVPDASARALVRVFLKNRLLTDYREVSDALRGLPEQEARDLSARLDKQGVPKELQSGAPFGRLMFFQHGSMANDKFVAEAVAGQRLGFGLDAAGKPTRIERPFAEDAWIEVMYVEKVAVPRAFASTNKFGNWFMTSARELFTGEGRLYSPAELQERYATPGQAPTDVGLFEITGVIYRGRGGPAWGHEGGPFQILFRQPEVHNAAKVVAERPLGAAGGLAPAMPTATGVVQTVAARVSAGLVALRSELGGGAEAEPAVPAAAVAEPAVPAAAVAEPA